MPIDFALADATVYPFESASFDVLASRFGVMFFADPALSFQAKYGPDTFLAIEKWESMDALKAHAAAPHMAAYGASTKELIASRVIHILSPAS